MEDQAIKDYFHFDEADLMANRNGQLTAKQQQKILRNWRVYSLFFPGLVLCSLAVPIGFFTFGPRGLADFVLKFLSGAAIKYSDYILSAVALVVFFGAGGVYLAWTFFWLFLKKRVLPTLKTVTGPVTVDSFTVSGRYGSGTRLLLHVGDKIFAVEKSVAGLFAQGDIYAVYYMDDSTISSSASIVSLERLSAGSPP